MENITESSFFFKDSLEYVQNQLSTHGFIDFAMYKYDDGGVDSRPLDMIVNLCIMLFCSTVITCNNELICAIHANDRFSA